MPILSRYRERTRSAVEGCPIVRPHSNKSQFYMHTRTRNLVNESKVEDPTPYQTLTPGEDGTLGAELSTFSSAKIRIKIQSQAPCIV